jgi:hypothetical protein
MMRISTLSEKHIRQLAVPEGCGVEYFPVRSASSLASAYNQALDHPLRLQNLSTRHLRDLPRNAQGVVAFVLCPSTTGNG